jgi:hypothetical protein
MSGTYINKAQRWIFLVMLGVFVSIQVQASVTDSIATHYVNGKFITYYKVQVNASDSICLAVSRDFVQGMCFQLDKLFGWALKDMNLRKEHKELMMFYFKSTSYNAQNHILRGIGDVIVPGIITIPDIYVDSRLTVLQRAHGVGMINLNLVSASGFIKKMDTGFRVIPNTHHEAWLVLESHIRFGWFFDMFITENRFKGIMEWRLKRFVNNLKDEAERREKNLHINIKH